MKQEKYEEIIVASDYLEYEFTSISLDRNITKCLQFNPTQNMEIVNLLFGNKREDGSIDDLARDNNRDRNKILATIVYIISLFTKEYPKKWVFFAGSTPERTRLYRMAITLNLDELSDNYTILGVLQDIENNLVSVPFQKGINYFGFLIKRKII